MVEVELLSTPVALDNTTGYVLNKSLPMTARQFTELYIKKLESTSEYCTNYLHSSPRTITDILTRLVPDPPETTRRTTPSTNDTANESTIFQVISDTLDTFYPQVSSTHQAQLDADRAKRQAENAFNARYKGRQIESATAATATALNGEKDESRSTIKSLIQGEMKSSAPKIVGSILKKTARKNLWGARPTKPMPPPRQ